MLPITHFAFDKESDNIALSNIIAKSPIYSDTFFLSESTTIRLGRQKIVAGLIFGKDAFLLPNIIELIGSRKDFLIFKYHF